DEEVQGSSVRSAEPLVNSPASHENRRTGRMARRMRGDHLPDCFDEARDIVIFRGRGTVVAVDPVEKAPIMALDPEAYARARETAPGWDVRVLEGARMGHRRALKPRRRL